MALGREMSTPPLLQWSMAHFTFSLSKRLYHNNTHKKTQTHSVGPSVFFCVFSLGLYFVYSFVFLWFVGVSPSFYVSLGSWVISLTVFGVSITNLNEPPRASATSTIAWVRSQLHPYWAVVKKKQRGFRGLWCRWPSITEWEMYITVQGPRLRNDVYCVEWDVKLYHTIPCVKWDLWCMGAVLAECPPWCH